MSAPRTLLSRLAPAVVTLGVLALGLAIVSWVGAQTVLAIAGACALLAVAVLAGSVVAVSRLARRRLSELTYLPDLGHRVVTQHDHATVTDVTSDAEGLVLHVCATEVQRIVLDESGAPDHMSAGAAGTSTWRIPSSSAGLGPAELGVLQSLRDEHVPVRIVSEGVVGLAGPVETGWRLEADNGLVVEAGA